MKAQAFSRSTETVKGGFATPHRLTGLPGELSGCLHRADGSKVALSERVGGQLGDIVVTGNPDRAEPPKGARTLHGRGLYLGHLMAGHYGHFITEGLSTFWIFREHAADEFDYFLFHKFVFGAAIPDYARDCLAMFGVPLDKVAVVDDQPLLVEEVLVPERLLILNHSADPQLRWVYDHIAGASGYEGAGDRVYLSRRRFNRSNFDRVVANEAYVEALFERLGFHTVFPEAHSFAEQAAICRRAKVLAGQSGSGLHNAIFMAPGHLLIELGDPRYGGRPAPTQVLCNLVAGCETQFIPFRGRRIGPKGTMLVDLGWIAGELAALAPAGGASPPAPRRRLLRALEMAYLASRPTLGHWAGQLIRRLPGRRKPGASTAPG